MKTHARLCLMFFAGLALTGCATKSALTNTHPVAVAAAREEKPESSRDHWDRRDLEDKIERTFALTGSR